jgi:integrase
MYILRPVTPNLRPALRQHFYQLRQGQGRMATIRKRGKSWRAELCVNTVRDSRTFDTKSEAMTWAVAREAELKVVAPGEDDHSKRTGPDLFGRYLKEVSSIKRGAKWEKIRLLKFMDYHHFKRPLRQITPDHIAHWKQERLKSVSPSTVRREMNLLSHCFETARKDWRWLSDNPCTDVSKPPDGKARDRLISNDEITLIRHALGWPVDGVAATKMQSVAVGFMFAIETGMRMGEICGLTHEDIVGSVATLRQTKNGTARRVPLSKRAVELLSFVPDLWDMKPHQFEALFRKGRDRSGVVGLTFHDTRHEAITRLAKKLDVLELARMVGHKNINQLLVYFNAKAEDIADMLG